MRWINGAACLFLLSFQAWGKVNFELWDEDKDIPKQDVVFSVSLQLDQNYEKEGAAKKFHQNVEKIFNAKYFGYALESKQTEGKYAWADSIKIFTARYGKTYTASWRPSGETPDDEDFAYKDSRSVAEDFVPLTSQSGLEQEKNLVILRGKVRSGYEKGAYVYRKAVLLLFLDKITGTRKIKLYVSLKSSHELFSLSATFPESLPQTSLTNIVKAADIMTAVNQGNPPTLDVPHHNFVSETFRHTNNESLRGKDQPYGKPLEISVDVGTALNECLESDVLKDETFKSLTQYLESAS